MNATPLCGNSETFSSCPLIPCGFLLPRFFFSRIFTSRYRQRFLIYFPSRPVPSRPVPSRPVPSRPVLLVEHRTGIAEVTGSNPVEALIFFRLHYSNCLNWKFTAKITYHLHIYPQFIYESFHIHYIIHIFHLLHRSQRLSLWCCRETVPRYCCNRSGSNLQRACCVDQQGTGRLDFYERTLCY